MVVDSPPLLGCAETVEFAAAAEVAVLTVRSGQTPMKVLGGAAEMLRRVNVPIAGIVLNESAIADRYHLQSLCPILYDARQCLEHVHKRCKANKEFGQPHSPRICGNALPA